MTVISLVGISLPTFFIATVFKLIFAIRLKWFDIGGMHSRDFIASEATGWETFVDLAKHFFLPALTLIFLSIGGLMRYTRTNMLEVLNADYIRTARAKGLPESKVIGLHAFRNTLIPVVTLLGGTLPGLFSGAMITETLFSIEGIGYVSYQSMVGGDIPFTMFYLALMSVLTSMKAIPLAYNKDMQEDKEQLFDVVYTANMSVVLFAGMIDTMTFNKDIMENSAKLGFTNATDAADYLVKKGMPFRDAHEVIGKIVLFCIDNNKSIDELSMTELHAFSEVFDEDIYDAISLKTCVDSRITTGAPGRASMNKAIAYYEDYLS